MTREEFIQKLRTKYPGWNKIDDDTMVNQVLERYPSYRSQITEPVKEEPVMTEQEKPGFFSRAGTALKERFGEIKKTFGEQARGEITPVETGIRVVGDVVAGAGDVAGAAISPQLEKLAQKEWAKPAFNALSGGMEKYEEWKNSSEINRRTAEVLEGIVNIADLAGFVAGSKVAGKAVVKTGKEIAESAAETAGRAVSKIDDVLQPAVKTVREAATEVIPTRSAMISGQITKALDLTAGDVSNIKLATKNDIGEWVTNNNLIAGNKKGTIEKINNFVKQQYDLVREEIDKVHTIYTSKTAPRVRDSLLLLRNDLQGVFGQEGVLKEIDTLLKQKTYTLGDVQRVKELLDDQFDIYKATGDVKAGQTKVGLANVRKEIKEFIETEVKNNTGADIRALNNDVATGRNITKLAEKRSTRAWTRANVSLSDLGVFGTGSLIGTPLTGAAALFVKRVLESSTVRLKVANFLKKLPTEKLEKIKNTLLKGEVPDEIKIIDNKDFKTPAVGQTATDPRNFKTAEEYVKAQGTPVYHGTNYANARMIQKEGINPENAGAIQEWMKGNKYSFFTGDEKYAQSYAIQKGGGDTKSGRSFVLAIKSPKDIQIEPETFKKGMKFPDLVSQQKISPEDIYIKGIDNKWYPIKEFNFFTGESDTFVGKKSLDELPFKTKSQLIDIWNKANK